MAAITALTSWLEIAHRRFPYIAKHNIRGSGRFALRLCRKRVLLYETDAERNTVAESYGYKSCGAFNCSASDHVRVDL
jgi:hypothetical protein